MGIQKNCIQKSVVFSCIQLKSVLECVLHLHMITLCIFSQWILKLY